MYQTIVSSQNQALCHLFFHCCLEDGRFTEQEVDLVSDIFVKFGLEHDLNFKEEIQDYRSYAGTITDEQAYIDHLVHTIMPVNELAIFSWCVEIALADDKLSAEEEALMSKIAISLDITDEEASVISKLMVQRRVVLSEKIC